MVDIGELFVICLSFSILLAILNYLLGGLLNILREIKRKQVAEAIREFQDTGPQLKEGPS